MEYFLENRHQLQGNWSIATCNADLEKQVNTLKPRFIFFPHWSEIVPASIFDSNDCVCFHMTDVPFGRGGSPLQNLIIRGFSDTFITAFKMTRELDAGPVYIRRELDLSGSALDIFKRAAPICFDMMTEIIAEEMDPTEQVGDPTVFKRRLSGDSEILNINSIKEFFDHIRMLDAPGYPPAFLVYNGFKIEFSSVDMKRDDELVAKVKVKKHEP